MRGAATQAMRDIVEEREHFVADAPQCRLRRCRFAARNPSGWCRLHQRKVRDFRSTTLVVFLSAHKNNSGAMDAGEALRAVRSFHPLQEAGKRRAWRPLARRTDR